MTHCNILSNLSQRQVKLKLNLTFCFIIDDCKMAAVFNELSVMFQNADEN